jgi:hypothetical protein
VNVYARAFLRFWWLLLIGVAAGVAVLVYVAKHHKPTTYTAGAQLLVDSGDHPYLRTSVLKAQPQKPQVVRPPSGKAAANGASTQPEPTTAAQAPLYVAQAPNTSVLLEAATFYPKLVNSDQFTAYRQKLFGAMSGSVFASAVGSAARGKKAGLAAFPIVQIGATAGTAAGAKRLAATTAIAFRRWVAHQQTAARIPASQRILLRPLTTPAKAGAIEHKHNGLAALAGIAVFAAFLAVAVGLDRLRPRRRPVAAVITEDYEELPRPVQAGTHVQA